MLLMHRDKSECTEKHRNQNKEGIDEKNEGITENDSGRMSVLGLLFLPNLYTEAATVTMDGTILYNVTSSVQNYKVKDFVCHIGDYAFNGNNTIRSMTMPDSV